MSFTVGHFHAFLVGSIQSTMAPSELVLSTTPGNSISFHKMITKFPSFNVSFNGGSSVGFPLFDISSSSGRFPRDAVRDVRLVIVKCLSSSSSLVKKLKSLSPEDWMLKSSSSSDVDSIWTFFCNCSNECSIIKLYINKCCFYMLFLKTYNRKRNCGLLGPTSKVIPSNPQRGCGLLEPRSSLGPSNPFLWLSAQLI